MMRIEGKANQDDVEKLRL